MQFRMTLMRVGCLLTLVSFHLIGVLSVKHHDFKTCSQSGFCRRGRALAERSKTGTNWVSPYALDSSTIKISRDESTFSALVRSSLYPDIKFKLDLSILEDGVIRARMDQVEGIRQRYDGAASWALIAEPKLSRTIEWIQGSKDIRASYGEKKQVEARITYSPLRIALLRNGKEEVVINGDGLFHMEHFRAKTENLPNEKPPASDEVKEENPAQTVVETPARPQAWFEGDEDDWWEEQFSSWKDSKPKGPESLSIDVAFPSHGHVYGIPEHATNLALPSTIGEGSKYTDPYRLYNADVFEYEADSPMTLYGAIPLLHAHAAHSTVGFFNLIASETWVDVWYPSKTSSKTHWISESGVMDLFIFPGPSAEDVFAQYSRLTGTPVLPAEWALGYHQCRWNYMTSDDVRSVQRKLDEEGMPFDVIWLDIEHTEDHKYFIWNDKAFPDPVEMVNDLVAVGRKLVAIVDPHIKRVNDYPIYSKAKDIDVFVKDPKSGEYEGWCWPGSSSWVDFFNPRAWDWWKNIFKFDGDDSVWRWKKSNDAVFVWNDMNEPAVFNGPEITMPKDNLHHGGWEHRDIHNINGMLFHNATYQALLDRSNPPKRPFVLTRSFFSGSQRFGAMWTGDNMGTWEHMAVGVKMVLSINIAGMPFAGSDVGGFFGNPDPEMLTRWYQVGIFAPFFRAHAHIDTKRREPYLLAEPHKGIVRSLLRLRYAMLPVWYTLAHEASVSGVPILRPHYVVFPKDSEGFALDDQYFIGSGLLVKPIVQQGVTETQVYLPEDEAYYHYTTNHLYRGSSSGKRVTVSAQLHEVVLFRRGGSITVTKERPRRASTLMRKDPYTLTVALSKSGSARGEVYIDDGASFAYEKGDIVWRGFQAETDKKGKLVLTSKDLVGANPKGAVEGTDLANYNPQNSFAKEISTVRVERVVILGFPGKPKSVKTNKGKEVEWIWSGGERARGKKEGAASVLVLKDPGLFITQDWSVIIEE